jgi:hypothetical protein
LRNNPPITATFSKQKNENKQQETLHALTSSCAGFSLIFKQADLSCFFGLGLEASVG